MHEAAWERQENDHWDAFSPPDQNPALSKTHHRGPWGWLTAADFCSLSCPLPPPPARAFHNFSPLNLYILCSLCHSAFLSYLLSVLLLERCLKKLTHHTRSLITFGGVEVSRCYRCCKSKKIPGPKKMGQEEAGSSVRMNQSLGNTGMVSAENKSEILSGKFSSCPLVPHGACCLLSPFPPSAPLPSLLSFSPSTFYFLQVLISSFLIFLFFQRKLLTLFFCCCCSHTYWIMIPGHIFVTLTCW